MDASLKKIIELLGSDNAELQCAAAVVLGELGATEKAAAQALGKTLSSQNTRLRMCALNAIGKIGGEACVKAVVPLLKEQGEVRQKAIATLSALGGEAIKQLKGELSGKDRALKMAVIKIILGSWGKDTLKTLFTCLFDNDFEVVKYTCDAVRAQADRMDARQRGELCKETAEFLGLKKVKASKSATISGLRLLGYSRQPKAKALLLKYAAPKNEVSIRRHALISLRHLEYPPTGNEDVIKAALKFLGEADFQNIVSSALDVLKAIKIPEKITGDLIKLLESVHSAVRLFAAGVLAQCDSDEAAKALSELSDDKEQAIREAAAAALAKNPAAVAGLIKKLGTSATTDEAWATAKILRGHADHVKPAVVKSLTDRMFQLLEKESDFYRPYYYLASTIAPEATFKSLLDRGLKQQKAKRLDRAQRYLQLIPDAPSSPPEAKFNLACVRLKLSKKDRTKAARDNDLCLKQFADLARKEGFDLLGQLKKAPLVRADELLYLGFHLTEEPEPLHKTGREVLTYVARKWPKTKQGKDARAKLETEKAPPPLKAEIPEAVRKKVESMW